MEKHMKSIISNALNSIHEISSIFIIFKDTRLPAIG